MIKCIECKFLKRAEYSVSGRFVQETETSIMPNGTILEVPPCRLECTSGVQMCCHADCYTFNENIDPINGKTNTRVRIAGQYQFNHDNKCSRFMPSLMTRMRNYWN